MSGTSSALSGDESRNSSRRPVQRSDGSTIVEPASFRDPAGFVYSRGGVLLRQINRRFADDFEAVATSGLYEELTRDGLLIPHQRRDLAEAANSDAYAVIAPRRLPFISYPYEWSFSQLRDAALLTLEVQDRALARGMTLRDASAYNVQFENGKPIFIDSLSFARYTEGQPWVGYKQFCEHFLAPLALMTYRHSSAGLLHRGSSDGVPLTTASALLPPRTRFALGLLLHIHLHASAQRKFADRAVRSRGGTLTLAAQRRLLVHLRKTIERLKWHASGTVWAEYESEHQYSAESIEEKKRMVADFVRRTKPRMVWDLGANTGLFSRIAAENGCLVISMDFDAAAVERNYLRLRTETNQTILPLVMDLFNPSPANGWANTERKSLAERGPADLLLALALIHHLTLSGNVPFGRIAEYFARLGNALVIEYVPYSDPQVQRLVQNRVEKPHEFSQAHFETAFAAHFDVAESRPVGASGRTLYLMMRKNESS
jgi:hypothetical protein